MKNAAKRTLRQEQLAQVCSQIVSLFLFCVSLKFALFAENNIKIGVSANKKRNKHKKTKILVLKMVHKYVAQHNWTNF